MTYDKYFQHLFDLTSDETLLVKSGYLNEGNWDGDMHLNQLTTPLNNIIRNSDGHNEVSVLLYPGCFAPIHEGHLEAMKIAKRTVEQQTGETVAAGYFAPDHDDYVQLKTGDKRFDGPNRIKITQSVIADSSWMDVDPWSALFATQSLNFTTLYERFVQYVAKWVPELKVKVYLVFGEDNILFANAYLNNGYTVCVLRTESNPDMTQLLDNPENRTLFSNETPPAISSSAVRKQKIKALPQVKEALGRSILGTDYVLRDDLKLGLVDSIFYEKHQQIGDNLCSILEKFIPKGINLKRINVTTQLEAFTAKDETISLDTFWKGTYSLQISRLFDVSSHQTYSRKYVNRPNSPSLEQQLEMIPTGSYALVDDDIASGRTMTTVETLLNSYGIGVHRKMSLLEDEDINLFDIVDARDFIIGAKHGGLVVKTPLGITRVPYLSPFVNLVTRANLNPEDAINFSHNVWVLNYELYVNSGVTVKDITEQDFMKLGFAPEQTIEEVCKTFIKS